MTSEMDVILEHWERYRAVTLQFLDLVPASEFAWRPDPESFSYGDHRETWPPFFEWQARGASFEIESLEITAGDDVAFAFALLRSCGTPQELRENPANRLRLTLGLRKKQGRWIVTHEHHSFPYAPEDAGRASEAEA